MILALILILIIIATITAAAIASDEARKLDNPPGSDNTFCLDYYTKYGTEFECPYNQNACNNNSPGIWCVFNPQFLRYFDIKKFLKGGYTIQDTFNQSYFVKRDTRKIVTLKCAKDLSQCEIEGGNYIKIANENVIRVSKNPKTDEYYIFSPVSFYTETLPRFISEKGKFDSPDKILDVLKSTPYQDCTDADAKQQGELKNVCIFHKVTTIDSIATVLEKIVYKNIDRQVLLELRQKIYNGKTMDLLDYIIYMSLGNFLQGSQTRLFWGV